MKKFTLLLIILCASLHSCEEVVDVQTGTMEPKLVVDASINWIKGTSGKYQVIRLSTTADYYAEQAPSASGAIVEVSAGNGQRFTFLEDDAISGNYLCDNFVPLLYETYTLTVIYNGETYTASETLYPAPDLLYTTQEKGGFLGDGKIIKAFFMDTPNQENFYMHQFSREGKLSQVAVFDDSFVDGNETFTVRFFDELPKDQIVQINLISISERYYNYMTKILTTVSDGNVGPFQVAPAQLRGNIINQTNEEDTAFGYFRLSEVSQIEHTVE